MWILRERGHRGTDVERMELVGGAVNFVRMRTSLRGGVMKAEWKLRDSSRNFWWTLFLANVFLVSEESIQDRYYSYYKCCGISKVSSLPPLEHF